MAGSLQWKQAHPFGLFDPLGCLELNKSLSYFQPFFSFIYCWLCRVRSYLLSGTWDLSSLTRDQTCSLCVGRLVLHRWTTREVPHFIYPNTKDISNASMSLWPLILEPHIYMHSVTTMHPNFRNAEVETNYTCRKTSHPVSVSKNLTTQSEYLRLNQC